MSLDKSGLALSDVPVVSFTNWSMHFLGRNFLSPYCRDSMFGVISEFTLSNKYFA